jgi:hypothetical protein
MEGLAPLGRPAGFEGLGDGAAFGVVPPSHRSAAAASGGGT